MGSRRRTCSRRSARSYARSSKRRSSCSVHRRTQAKTLGVSLDDVFNTLQVYLGSSYANDFTRFGRNWQVQVQADSPFRVRPEDIVKLKVRNAAGAMVPLGAL